MQMILAAFLSLMFSFSAFSGDRWNTYQWNRRNVIRQTGGIDRSPWFEWWYYKVVLPESGKSFYFVYGVVNPWDVNSELKGTRSYVGFGDFSRKLIAGEEFPLSEFSASYEKTLVLVRNNQATGKSFSGSLTDEQGRAHRWGVSIEKEWGFNPEGWMMGTLLTDIEWYPAQASARCSGTVESEGQTVSFTDAPCYQDRNWGKRFPDWWTWIVSNHFTDSPGTVLVVGGGKPHVRGQRTPVASVSVGLRYQGKEIAFRPNELQFVSMDIRFGKWQVSGINRTYRIEIEARAPREKFLDLQFMTPTGEIFHDYETLTGEVTVKLFERKGLFFKPVAVLQSEFGGIEFGSADIQKLLRLPKTNLLSPPLK